MRRTRNARARRSSRRRVPQVGGGEHHAADVGFERVADGAGRRHDPDRPFGGREPVVDAGDESIVDRVGRRSSASSESSASSASESSVVSSEPAEVALRRGIAVGRYGTSSGMPRSRSAAAPSGGEVGGRRATRHGRSATPGNSSMSSTLAGGDAAGELGDQSGCGGGRGVESTSGRASRRSSGLSAVCRASICRDRSRSRSPSTRGRERDGDRAPATASRAR